MISKAVKQKHLYASFRSVEVDMSDGVSLVADLWHCDPAVPRPVVLERTPYGRGRTDQAEREAMSDAPLRRAEVAEIYFDAGFAYVVQDCRGTGESAGIFDKYLQEPGDTATTVDWIRQQAWCDGRVAMAGFSYGASCQLAAMVSVSAVPDVTVLDCGGFSDALKSGIRQGGALLLKQATWALAQAIRDARKDGDEETALALETVDVLGWLHSGAQAPGQSPLSVAPTHERALARMWACSTDSQFWQRPGLRTPPLSLQDIPTRSLFVTSWHDTSLRGTLENFAAMSAPESICPAPELIVGPWTHGDRWSSQAGGVDFGPTALPEAAFGASFPVLRSRYLRRALQARDRPLLDGENTVHWFEICGPGSEAQDQANKFGGSWRRGASWPPDNTNGLSLYLADEQLTIETPDAPPRRLVSDPTNPVPTLGGAINSGGNAMPGGMWEQSPLDNRKDILRYLSAPFIVPTVLTGPVCAAVWIETDAPDVDIAIKLVLVLADGRSYNLSDGLCRARQRDGYEKEAQLTLGTPTCIPVELNPIAVRLMPGQSLRLDISASNFPCFDINPQTGVPQGAPGLSQIATIRVLTDPCHSSCLELTVVPE